MSKTRGRMSGWLASFVSVACLLSACDAHTSSDRASAFKPECVGRTQFSLPEAEVAVITNKALLRDAKGIDLLFPGGALSMATQFSDGQDASYSEFDYEGGVIVSSPVDDALATTVFDLFEKDAKKTRRTLKPSFVDSSGQPMKYFPIEGLGPDARGWRLNWDYQFIKRIGPTVMKWSASHGSKNDQEVNTRAFNSLRDARARPLNTLPTAEPGVCLPYLFVPDNGEARRDIQVTYRLKEHPDVTVWLRDRDGGRSVYDNDSKMSAAHYDVRFFWNLNYSNRKSVVMKENHTFRLAGIEGEYSVVELTRKDDTIDYGYFASAIDDPEKIANPTNLQMFVIRDAQNAKAKGVEPMPKDEFIQLAKAIAATVQKRPVSTTTMKP